MREKAGPTQFMEAGLDSCDGLGSQLAEGAEEAEAEAVEEGRSCTLEGLCRRGCGGAEAIAQEGPRCCRGTSREACSQGPLVTRSGRSGPASGFHSRAVSRMTLRNAMNKLGLPPRSHVTNGAARV